MSQEKELNKRKIENKIEEDEQSTIKASLKFDYKSV